jgi:hypothetical protein
VGEELGQRGWCFNGYGSGRRNHQAWSAVAADPNLSPKAAQAARQAARSSAAAAKLSQNALNWAGLSPEEQEKQLSEDQMLATALGMGSPPSTSSGSNPEGPTSGSPTKPGTSGSKTSPTTKTPDAP